MAELASKHNTMPKTQNNQDQEQVVIMSKKQMKRRRQCKIAIGVVLLLLLTLVIVAVVLAFTLFKSKDPKIELESTTLEGVAPRVTLPAIDIQLNITLNISIKVENPNRVRFKSGHGISLLLYKGKEVGDTDIYPGLIPSRGSTVLSTRLTLEADKLASSMDSFVEDLMGGNLTMEADSEIPGRVTFLGFIKKHVVAKSNCQFTIGIPDFKIKSQHCKNKAKL